MSYTMTLSAWMNELDALVTSKVGLSLTDLPHQDYFAAHDAGITPSQFFNEVLLPELRDLGADPEVLSDLHILEDLSTRYLVATGDCF